MLSPVSTVILTTLIAVFLVRRRKKFDQSRNFTLPPGPPGLPIIGNLFDLAKEHAWIGYSDWSKIYGDLMFLRVFSTPMVIVSCAETAFDLMEKRSAIYSSRDTPMMDKMTAWEFNLAFIPYGQRWRNIRRKVHEHFHQLITPKYHDQQSQQVHSFLRRCLDETGSQFDSSQVRYMLAATVMDIVYGIEITGMDDEHMKLIVESLEILGESKIPGKYWADYIPLLQYVPSWVPGAASAKFAAQSRSIVQEMVDKPFDHVMNEKTPKNCIVVELLAKIAQQSDADQRKAEEVHARHAAGIIYAAAVETTHSLLQTFFCSMATNRDVQQAARDELDSVVGQDRLPTYEDQDSLPYIEAIFRECMRWMPVVPLGVSHSVIEDDIYGNYFIPSGTVIIPNVWHMLHNRVEYPEPEKFKPDRFLKSGTLDPAVRDPTTIAFGFGRRICPGRHFAKDGAFLVIASILHAFEIFPALDENGNELDPTPQLEGSLTACPTPLRYRLKIRSSAAERLVRATDV